MGRSKVFLFRKQNHAKKSLQRNDFFIQKRDISSLLQANCHIGRDAKDVILDGQIARMDDIAFPDPALVFLPEFQKGLCSIVCTGLDLDGVHLVLGFTVVGDDEIDLNVVALLFLVIMGVEK